MIKNPRLIENDPWLEPYKDAINRRMNKTQARESELVANATLQSFASGHLWFGLHRLEKGWIMREWAPNATEIFLTGTFNNWQEEEAYRFTRLDFGNWEIRLEKDAVSVPLGKSLGLEMIRGTLMVS